jgi:hypothetical protein
MAIHELQSVTIRQTCDGIKARDTERCLQSSISSDCDVASFTVRRNALKNGVIVSAIVREASPDSTKLVKNGATPMQMTCIGAISEALSSCAPGCPDAAASFQEFTTCSDGFRNGDETGRDCGGNDCEECTEPERNNGGLTGGDPHFVARMRNGVDFCYDVHGTPGDVLNLVSGQHILVNSLIIGAPNTVSGTYHGAVGIVARKPDGSGRRDSLAVLADGTVRFNGLLVPREDHKVIRGAEMVVNTSATHVSMSLQSFNVSFRLKFVDDTSGGAHLDLAVTDQRGLNGTRGIIGQFVNAKASISPKDDKKSIMTINGRTVEVVKRRVPQLAGSDDDRFCYKYMDLQAAGVLEGTVADYKAQGIYDVPKFVAQASSLVDSGMNHAELDQYVLAVAESERTRLDQIRARAQNALQVLNGKHFNHTRVSDDELRNTLIQAMSSRLGFAIKDLQAIPTEGLAQRALRSA